MNGLAGLGVGWRPALTAAILRRDDVRFVEVVAEACPAERPLPAALDLLRLEGATVVPHGIGLSLGSAEGVDPDRVAALARLAERVEAPLVSEHIAFVRAGGVEAGHLLPVPRTRAQLEVLVENVCGVMAELPVPLALEPVATVFEWPGAEMDEGAFLTELLDRTGAFLLLDVANVYGNARNRGEDPGAALAGWPLDRVAYVHVAGGVECGGLYHDTHAHPVVPGVLGLLVAAGPVPAVMLERDRNFPTRDEWDAELDAIASAAHLGGAAPRPSPGPARPAPRATVAARSELAVRQKELVTALLRTSAWPPGFDPERLDAAATALSQKRAREVAGRGPVPTGR